MDRCLIVIDFNGTLLRRLKSQNLADVSEETVADAKNKFETIPVSGEKLLIRPGARQLATFLDSNNVDYCFWTSALMKNAAKLERVLVRCGFNRAKYLLSQEDCIFGGTVIKDGRRRVKFIKDLEKLWADAYYYHPENVILIDDSEYKVWPKQRKHLLCISEFNPVNEDLKENEEDLFALISYLEAMTDSCRSRKKTCVQFMAEKSFDDWLKERI